VHRVEVRFHLGVSPGVRGIPATLRVMSGAR
jgi:hypothetical protein